MIICLIGLSGRLNSILYFQVNSGDDEELLNFYSDPLRIDSSESHLLWGISLWSFPFYDSKFLTQNLMLIYGVCVI